MEKEIWRQIKQISIIICRIPHFIWPQYWKEPKERIGLYPQFSLLNDGHICCTYLTGLWLGLNDLKHVKYLEYFLDIVSSEWIFTIIIGLSSSCSVQFSRSVVSDSLRPHESQHARPPCPSPSPRVHSDSRPSSQWCHPTISSSVVPFSSCPQSLPASESFPMSQLFASGGQSTGISPST